MRQLAFTTRFDRQMRVLLTKVGVCLPITPEEAKTQQIKLNRYFAIWDTGATNSAITKKVANELGLQPTGIAEVRYGSGAQPTNTYLVNISLPMGVMIGHVRVTEVQELMPDVNIPEDQQPQVLVGMDIIGMGDFAVTNVGGKTTLSFRIPSRTEIDFIPESNENNVQEYGNREQRRALEAKKRKGLI
ncbi:MAG: aspartyl protease family protein [Candidatus Liptonbacteria bacterium]|nr:aspartyl protease family protein [Candidatus Liptonbacteria bacterium]